MLGTSAAFMLVLLLLVSNCAAGQAVNWKGIEWRNLYGTETLTVNPSTGNLDITISDTFGGALHPLIGAGSRWIQTTFVDSSDLTTNSPSPTIVGIYFDSSTSSYLASVGGVNGDSHYFATVRRDMPLYNPISETEIPIGFRSQLLHCAAVAQRADGAIEYWLDGTLKSAVPENQFPGPFQYAYLVGQASQAGQIISFVDYKEGMGPYPVSECGCGRPTFTGSYPTSLSPGSAGTTTGWHMSYNVSDQHGLELTDVALGSRYMAATMNLPYFYLKTSNFPNTSNSPDQRCTLTPNGLSGLCNSRLVDFQASGSTSPEIKATYEVDNVSTTNQNACVLITQDYQFSPPIYPALQGVHGCEPSDTLACAKFKPIVSYQFVPGDATETLTHINTAQQLHFAVDGMSLDSSGLFKDCDTPLPLLACNGLLFQNKINPLTTELYANGILSGGPGTWDNFHQTFKSRIQEPVIDLQSGTVGGAGCPECVHMHWRWGQWANDLGGEFGGGNPLLLNSSSNQDVYFAVVAWHPGEQDPNNITNLVNGEPLNPANTAFWYSATGYQDHDTFFYHGGFFSPPTSGPASVTASITKARSGNTETINLKLSNAGPGTAHRLSINQLLTRVLRGGGTVTYTGSSLPISIGDLIAGNFISYSLTFNVATTVQQFSLAEGISFQDDFGAIEGISFIQGIIP